MNERELLGWTDVGLGFGLVGMGWKDMNR